jgi:hypothetical protein
MALALPSSVTTDPDVTVWGVVQVTFGERRPQPTVDHAAGENFLLREPPFTPPTESLST